MGTIKLQNIRTFSFHGCLEEEAKIGSDYRVDLEIKTDLRKSAVSDDLKDTVDYVLLNEIAPK
jgi:dihydroneopterin aldolase